jgi:hypothetical protein
MKYTYMQKEDITVDGTFLHDYDLIDEIDFFNNLLGSIEESAYTLRFRDT